LGQKKFYTAVGMKDIQDTVDALQRAEEKTLKKSLLKMESLRRQYKQAVQKGQTVQAKQLRRKYFEQAFVNLAIMASPLDLLNPNPKLQAMMEKISHELEY
jgi:hypothetical protein